MLAAKTKVFKLRVDSLYNKAMHTLQKKNTRYEVGIKPKTSGIQINDDEANFLRELDGRISIF